MLNKHFDINANGNSIHCTIYATDLKKVEQVILFGHGFGGHRDNHAAARFAEVCLSKYKTAVLIVFDWPCHGSDARNKLTLDACDSYLSTVLDYIQKQYHPKRLLGYGTSFGGYQFLRYLHFHGNPFEKLVLRCPSVDLSDVFARVMTDEEKLKIGKGKDVSVGFDRKVKISRDFIEEISKEHLYEWDYLDYADDMMILHGTEDEIVPFDSVQSFAENNVIEFLPVEGVDHRFRNQVKMDAANHTMMQFLF